MRRINISDEHRNKKLSYRREAARCFVFVCSQLQHTCSAVFLLPITAASDLLVHKILLWLGYPMVKNDRIYLYSFYATHERGRHTDRQTDRQTPHDSIRRAYASHRAAKTSSASHVNFDLFVVFTARCICISAVYAVTRCLSVCPSVRLSVRHVRELRQNK